MKVGWPLFALWLQAGLWGLGAGFGLLLGAVIAYFVEFSHRLVAAVMSFGGGVLITVLAFELGVANRSIRYLVTGYDPGESSRSPRPERRSRSPISRRPR